MKKYFCFLILLLVSSCNHTKETEPERVGDESTTTFLHTFVTDYMKGDSYSVTYADEWFTIGVDDRSRVQISAPELSGTADEAEHAEFRQLSERNGDTSYDRDVTYLVSPDRACLADNFAKIDVICTNRDLDLAHPAGTPVNDLINIRFGSCAPYIRDHYSGDEWTMTDKLLSELKDDDLTLLKPLFSLNFAKKVEAHVPYELEITLTTTEGNTHVIHATFRLLYDD